MTEEELFPPGRHERAEAIWRELRAHPHLPDRDSRHCELIEFLGWDVAQKAPFTTPWLFEHDPRWDHYRRQLGLEVNDFRLMHQVSLFNRLDPERHDMFWILDGLLARLEDLGGPDELSVLDFGCGPAQTGLAFASQGYRTVLDDVSPVYYEYQRFMASIRGLDERAVVVQTSEEDYYDTGADGHRYGLVVEWSTLEHSPDVRRAVDEITAGLVPGGIFLTTTLAHEWTPERREHYRQDALDEGIAEQLFSTELDAYLHERFEVLSPERTLAKVLVKRP